MRKRQRNLFVIGSIVLILTLVAALFFLRPRPDPTTVRIGYLNITASLPLFIAEEKGFLAEEGIKFETQPLTTSNQLVDGIVADNLDAFIEASAVPVLELEASSPGRLKVFSVSAISEKAPFDSLLVKEDSPIKDLPDLAGKKIGVFPGTTAATLLKKYLSDKGVDVAGITFTPLPPQNQLGALTDRAIDALHAYEPTTTTALSKGGVRQLRRSIYAEMLDPNPQGVAAVSTKFLQEHPQLAEKLIHALERAMVLMRENEAEARQIMAKRLKLEEPVASRTVFLYMLPHREIDRSVFQKYSDMLFELRELKQRVDITKLTYDR